MSSGSKSCPILGGQFGAQERNRPSIFLESDDDRSLSSVGNLGRRGQFGASNLDYQHEKDCSDSDEGTVIDESDATDMLESSQNTPYLLSERSRKTIMQTSNISKSFFSTETPFLLRLNKKPKKEPYSTELQTFSRSKSVIVTGNSGKNILFLVTFHPLKDKDPPCNNLVHLIEDLYVMSCHRSNLKNKNKLSGRMSGIGFRGGYEEGKTAGKFTFYLIFFLISMLISLSPQVHMLCEQTCQMLGLPWIKCFNKISLITTNFLPKGSATSPRLRTIKTGRLFKDLEFPAGLMNLGKAIVKIPNHSAPMSSSHQMTSPTKSTLIRIKTFSPMEYSATSTQKLELPSFPPHPPVDMESDFLSMIVISTLAQPLESLKSCGKATNLLIIP